MIVSADVWDCTFEKQIEMEKRDSYAEGVSVGISQGISQGISHGENRSFKLIKLLTRDNRNNDIEKATNDSSYREQLFKEYNIK